MSVVRPPIRVLLGAHLRADPRKSVVLAALAGVMLFLYARWLWPGAGPEAAQAAGAPAAVISPSGAPAARPPTGGFGPPRVPVLEPVARALHSDPFALDLRLYPPAPEAPAEPAPSVATAAPAVEDPIEAAARLLTLQSTVIGERPLACINGEFLRPGQHIQGFVLERVESTHVVLGREGVKLELYLK